MELQHNEDAPPSSSLIDGADVSVAARNALKLGTSLIFTWALALAVRFQLPRYLGPIRFGNFNFCDAFTAAFFAFVGFGVDTYIQKEVSVRSRHASDFFAGISIARAAVSAVLIVTMLTVLKVTHRPAELMWVASIFAASQLVMTFNTSLGSILQATTKIGSLASVNVAAKVIWAAGLFSAIWLKYPLPVMALPSLVAEILRAGFLWHAAKKHAELRWHVSYAATKGVLLKALPYYVNTIALTLGGRLDVSMLEFQTTDVEVGWYSAAANIASLALLLSPLVGWVLMPLLSRAHHRSKFEFAEILRRAIEGMILASIPVTLVIGLGARLWIRLAFGSAYVPAAASLMVLAPMFTVTYLAILLAMAHIIDGRSWRLTVVSLIGLVIQPVLSLIFVPLMSRIGPGFAGSGAAIALIGQEVIIASILLMSMGRLAIDRRCIVAVSKCVVIALGVVLFDRAITRLGAASVFLDLLVFIVLAVVSRAIKLEEVWVVIALIRDRRQKPNAA